MFVTTYYRPLPLLSYSFVLAYVFLLSPLPYASFPLLHLTPLSTSASAVLQHLIDKIIATANTVNKVVGRSLRRHLPRE